MLKKRLSSNRGQIADILMFLFFISFVIYFVLAYTSMQTFFKTQEFVDTIVRTEVEIVRTKGIFKTEEYKSFLSKLSNYGQYNVYATIETQDAAGNYVKWFRLKEEILDRPLKVGDFIKISVESRKASLFSEIMARNFLFGRSGNVNNFKMQSVAAGMICTDGYIKGVEVINIIERYRSKVSVIVKTDNSNLDPALAPAEDTYNASAAYNHDTVSDDKRINLEGRFKMEMDRDIGTGEVTEITITQLDKHNLMPTIP